MNMLRALCIAALGILMIGCSQSRMPIKTMQSVDLDRFMGDWYVIANIPTFIEKGAHNAIESYRMNDDGTIATTFMFNKDSFTGELKKYTPTGFIKDKKSNAIWGMQFIWPIKADYRIVYVDADYTQTIIGRNARDYVWIMTRSPEIPDAEFNKLVNLVEQQGYDISKIRRVPQKW
jgi:apolipoprotein D and lipocalin family protein